MRVCEYYMCACTIECVGELVGCLDAYFISFSMSVDQTTLIQDTCYFYLSPVAKEHYGVFRSPE